MANGLEVETVPDDPPHPATAPRAESSPIANDIRSAFCCRPKIELEPPTLYLQGKNSIMSKPRTLLKSLSLRKRGRSCKRVQVIAISNIL
jgi:hypothetical protein